MQKNKLIIIISSIIFLTIILGLAVVSVFYFRKNNELSRREVNIIYYSENEKQNQEEDNLIIVNLGENSEINDEENNEENTEKNQEIINQEVDAPYYIKINNQTNVVTVYKKDLRGKYNTPIKAMLCSIGAATPKSGVYSISDKYVWRLLEGNVYGQYACRITGHILFHSVPYMSKDKSSLEWWEFDKLGTDASLGCVRLKVEDAKWIYDNCVPGTKVEFYYDPNPGPLGKPTVNKISEDEEVRNWDPSDPDNANPWREYLNRKEQERQEQIRVQEVSTEPEEKQNEVSKDIGISENINNENKNIIEEEEYTEVILTPSLEPTQIPNNDETEENVIE